MVVVEFHEKLLELRKQRGLTQEQLASALYVSRTAISKWESGRGYPHIDSLKAIAKFFGVTMDALLSGDELLTIAETDNKQKETQFSDLVFGLMDVGAAMLFFLPLFGQAAGGTIQAVPLLSLVGIAPYLQAVYYAVVLGMILSGVLTLTLQNCHHAFWERSKRILSLAVNVTGVLVFILGRQPYASVFMFLFLLIKVSLLKKRQ